MCTLQKQHDFFKSNKSMLLKDYQGKYIVISDSLDITSFNNISDAYVYGAANLGFGHFMIQKCTESADSVKRISNINLRAV